MASESILLTTALYRLSKEVLVIYPQSFKTKDWCHKPNKVSTRDRMLAQSHRCDAFFSHPNQAWGNIQTVLSVPLCFTGEMGKPQSRTRKRNAKQLLKRAGSLKMHAFAAYCQTVTESGVKHSSFAPVCQHFLMQSHLYQLWKRGQRRSRVENQTEASQAPFRTFNPIHVHREDNF